MKRVATIASRLKEYRGTNDLTLAEMSEKTGIPAQTLNRYELGQRAPKIDVAVDIAESLSVNPLWLQGYDVSIEKEPTPVSESGPVDSLDAQIMNLVRQLSPEWKKQLVEHIELIISTR